LPAAGDARNTTTRIKSVIRGKKGFVMGASGWDYVVAYLLDINQALQELQEKVFHEGDYRHILAESAHQRGEVYPLLTSIPMVQEQTSDSGTHSILDIKGISHLPQEEMICPLSADQLLALFQTATPSPAEIDQAEQEAARDGIWLFDCDAGLRNFGYYVVMYQDSEPIALRFTGMSGD
jgi:hypothetical protein